MPPADETPDESFRNLLLQLRGRTGLIQRELATHVGVSVGSIQGWEAGANFPGVASLKALIEAGLHSGGFTAGHEREEAMELWAAALRDAPRFRTPFDGAWFEQLVPGPPEPGLDVADRTVASPGTRLTAARDARRESWGEAPDVASFVNRVSERALLRQWVLDERSRLVAVLGLGGIGKSLLATRLAHDLAPSFERIFWRSLRDAPTPAEWLAEALRFLAPDAAPETVGEAALLRRFLELLSETRCLLVLDNVETVLQPGGPVGGYRAGHERYGSLLRQVAESPHQSCLVVTSREEPAEFGPLLGERGPVRALELAGFGTEDGRALLDDKQLDGDERVWRALVERHGGNGLALKVVGETTRELFGGSIADYLEYASATPGVMVGGVRELLQAQLQRLSNLEQEILRRLAVEREPVGLAELAAEFGPRTARATTLEAVERLRRRSLLERTVRGPLFGLHAVVLEYVTDQLIEDAAHELATGQLDLLLRQPLLKATAKDYVRRSQERLIVRPLVERLIEADGSRRAAEQRLLGLIERMRGEPARDWGYGPGNLVNLLRLLRGDLKGVNLSGLTIRQAYMQEVEAQGASLAGARISETVLGEAFNRLMALALSADNTYLVAGSVSGEVCWWRIADRTLLATLPGHVGVVWAVALSEDGRLVASGSDDGTVRLWDAATRRPLTTLQGHTAGVLSVALSGDGRLVASGSYDGTIRLWETASGRPLATIPGHQGGVRVALSGDGQVVASGGLDGALRLWEAPSGKPRASLHGHTGAIWGIALSEDGRLVAGGGVDGVARLWEARSGRVLLTLRGHTGTIGSVVLSRDGRLVASGGFDRVVRLWDAKSGQALATLRGHTGSVASVVLSADGRLVASAMTDGIVPVWETGTGRALATIYGHRDGVRGVALSGDGRLLASGGYDREVRLWDARTGRALTVLHGNVQQAFGVALSGDGQLVASAGGDGMVRVWDTESGQALAAFLGQDGGVWGVALSGDGRLLASGSFDGRVWLWEPRSGQPRGILERHSGTVRAIALSGDGRLLASGSVDQTVRLWDTENGQPLATLHGHAGEVYAVALSRDGRLVTSGGFDGTVRIWETATNAPLAVLRGHTGGVRGVALSGDGRLVTSGGFDGTVRHWEVETGQLLAALTGHTGGIWGVAQTDDGRLLASGGDDGTVRVWDLPGGAPRHVLRGERRYEALDITGLAGITDAQRDALLALGAVEQGGPA